MTTVSPMNLASGYLESFLTSSGEKTYGASTAAGGVFGEAVAFAAAWAASFSSESCFASTFTSETLTSAALAGCGFLALFWLGCCGVRSETGRGGEMSPSAYWGGAEGVFADMRK